LDHRKRSEQVGAPIGRRDDERQLLKRTIQALLAEGSTLLDAIEEAALVVRSTLDAREGDPRQPVDGDPPSGVRDVGGELVESPPCSESWAEAAHT